VVIGLSGSGKSTLLRCINRLIEPTSGSIRLGDVDITKLPASRMRRVRRGMGMIFQHFNLVSRSTVLTNVLTGRLGYTPTWRSMIGWFSKADHDLAMKNLERVMSFREASSSAWGSRVR